MSRINVLLRLLLSHLGSEMEIGVKTAKNELSRIIKAALAGEKVVITNHGKPLVRLVPETATPPETGYEDEGSAENVFDDRSCQENRQSNGQDHLEEGHGGHGVMLTVAGPEESSV